MGFPSMQIKLHGRKCFQQKVLELCIPWGRQGKILCSNFTDTLHHFTPIQQLLSCILENSSKPHKGHVLLVPTPMPGPWHFTSFGITLPAHESAWLRGKKNRVKAQMYTKIIPLHIQAMSTAHRPDLLLIHQFFVSLPLMISVEFRSMPKWIHRIKKENQFQGNKRLETIYHFLWKCLEHLTWEALHQMKEMCLPEWGVKIARRGWRKQRKGSGLLQI